MIGVLICGAVSLAIFALAALADERWPERLTRRGHRLSGEPWRGQWGAAPSYRVDSSKRSDHAWIA
jgi:hypothetical protein